jgi:excisionase family DNA binding protein
LQQTAEGLKVCAATVYKLCERGELPSVRVLNSIRIRREDVEAFVARAVEKPRRAYRRNRRPKA